MAEITQRAGRDIDDSEQLQDWVDGFIRPFFDLNRRINPKDPSPFARRSPRIVRSGNDEQCHSDWFSPRF